MELNMDRFKEGCLRRVWTVAALTVAVAAGLGCVHPFWNPRVEPAKGLGTLLHGAQMPADARSLFFLHAHHRAEAATDAPAPSLAVSVATADIGFIAHQLMVAGVFQAFQEIDVHGKVSGYMPSSVSQADCIGGARC
jgi:hypothetical protein